MIESSKTYYDGSAGMLLVSRCILVQGNAVEVFSH